MAVNQPQTPSTTKKGVDIINCVEFVNKTIKDKKIIAEIENAVNTKKYLDKNDLLKYVGWFVFTHGLHIGFAKMGSQYFECITLECSEDKVFSRWLSFFDDKLLIVKKVEKEKIQNEVERVFNELV